MQEGSSWCRKVCGDAANCKALFDIQCWCPLCGKRGIVNMCKF